MVVAPAPIPAAPPGRRRMVRIGMSLIVGGFLMGFGLIVLGLVNRGVVGPIPIRQAVRVTASDAGEVFAISRLRAGTAASCRVTTDAGAALSITRSPPAAVTVDGRRYQTLATFTANAPGAVTVVCPDSPQLFVQPREQGGRNVLAVVAVVAGLAVGGLSMGAGLIVALIGVLVPRVTDVDGQDGY